LSSSYAVLRFAVEKLMGAIKEWSGSSDGPEKVVIPLAHKYSADGFSPAILKGADMKMMDALGHASRVCSLDLLVSVFCSLQSLGP
jgi:hypothetical protein